VTWLIDCGHWHCPDRYDARHGHTETPDVCTGCAETPPESDRARLLRERAQRIAQRKADKQ
jgi:hypothetical protein